MQLSIVFIMSDQQRRNSMWMGQYLRLTAWRDWQYHMFQGGLSPVPSFAFLHKK